MSFFTIVRTVWGRIAAVMVFFSASILGLSYLETKVAESIRQLERFDLSRSLIVSAKVRPGERLIFTKRPTGRLDEFLMTQDSFDALSLLKGIESMHVYRELELEAIAESMPPTDIRLLVVPEGFISSHHLGDLTLDKALANECLVIPKVGGQNWRWIDNSQVDIRPRAEAREKIARLASKAQGGSVIDDGSFSATACVRDMALPTGLASFERTVFVSEGHSGLRDRTSFAKPLLWISIGKDDNPTLVLEAVKEYLATTAIPAAPQLELQVSRFGEFSASGINKDSLRAWQSRLRSAIWIVGIGLTLTGLLIRWGSMRRELALRSALGQSQSIAMLKVAQPWMVALKVGMLLGLTLAFGFSPLFGINPLVAVLSSGDTFLVIAVAMLMFYVAMHLALKSEPMSVLSKNIR